MSMLICVLADFHMYLLTLPDLPPVHEEDCATNESSKEDESTYHTSSDCTSMTVMYGNWAWSDVTSSASRTW